MANPAKRLIDNVEGHFYVDVRCINCDACRQLAPASFSEVGDYSAVTRQPLTEMEIRKAYHALLACPTGAIGETQKDKSALDAARTDFPLPIEENVYYCGFNSEHSFGANSFFIRHPDGNWLIDSPRYLKHLVEAFERLGGLSYIFLTHEDDVADAARYARRFGARCIIHRADAHAMPEAEEIMEGVDEILYRPEFRIIPVPGHTEGSLCLLYRDRFLFTGDHLWWEPETRQLEAPRQLVWNADALVRSCERLAQYSFEWVLAGHGGRIGLPQHEMRAALEELVLRRQGVRM
ncbi:MAG: MBL fold metallo-hydrolase [Nitrospira sp.]|nr:MBL fold metallo-hydrolase [Nitrospira sp.]